MACRSASPARTREYIEILRKIMKREAPLQHDGELYQIPYKGPGATGLGKPLKSILHGDPSMPIYAASITPIGLKVAGEVADGVLPIFMSPEKAGLVSKALREGIARGRPGRTLADFDVAPFVRINMGPDLQACRDALKPELALYIGGMGARTKNSKRLRQSAGLRGAARRSGPFSGPPCRGDRRVPMPGRRDLAVVSPSGSKTTERLKESGAGTRSARCC